MLIPKGILIDCCCVLLGTNLGSLLKDRVPQSIKEPMNVIFGLAAIAIGITSIIKLQTLPAVILALILGGLIGELLGLDGKVRRLFQSAIERLHFRMPGDRDAYMQFYLIVAVTLCACFYGAQFILPLTTPAMLNDFVAMGGLLTFVLGLSIARIKHISAVNLLPCLFLIWPCSWLFGLIA